jgi:hypothetical protein
MKRSASVVIVIFLACLWAVGARADDIENIRKLAQSLKDGRIITSFEIDESELWVNLMQAPPLLSVRAEFEKTMADQTARTFCSDATLRFSPWDSVWRVWVYLAGQHDPSAFCHFPVLPGQLR